MVRVALAALIFSSPLFGTITRVQHVFNTGGSGFSALSVTLTATSVGNLIVVCGTNTNTPTSMVVTDNASGGSNTYTAITGSPFANILACSWSLTTKSTTQATLTCNQTGAMTIEAIEYSGIQSSGSIDQASISQGTSATWSASITPTGGGAEAIVGFVHSATTGSYSAASGFTLLDQGQNSFDSSSAQDDITTPSGTVTFTGSTPGAASVAWQAAVFSFFAAPSASGGTIQVTQR